MLLSVTTAVLSANTVYNMPANPIVDSGATVSVVGRDSAPYADNRRPLRVPMEIVTANDNIIVNTVCDIPGNDIMNGAVIIESSAKSLLSLYDVCVKRGWGFEVGDGFKYARLVKDGKPVMNLVINGSLIEYPLNIKFTDQDSCLCTVTEPGYNLVQDANMYVTDSVLLVHNMVVAMNVTVNSCFDSGNKACSQCVCVCMIRENS